MAKYQVEVTYYSESQKRVLTEGEVIEVNEKEEIKSLDASIKKFGPGYLKKVKENSKTEFKEELENDLNPDQKYEGVGDE
jgi:glycine cleavage system H lipoate-binding protein